MSTNPSGGLRNSSSVARTLCFLLGFIFLYGAADKITADISKMKNIHVIFYHSKVRRFCQQPQQKILFFSLLALEIFLTTSEKRCMSSRPLVTSLRPTRSSLIFNASTAVVFFLRPVASSSFPQVLHRPFSTSFTPCAKLKKMAPKKKVVEEKKIRLGRPGNNLKVNSYHVIG